MLSGLPRYRLYGKGIYHIGDTIDITDNLLNRAEKDATSVTIQYYKKGGGTIVYDETKSSLGTIAAGDDMDFTYSYTFTPDDQGQIEIAAIITYTYQGGTFEEYCVSHFYNVDDTVVAPEPVVESTATPVVEETTSSEDTNASVVADSNTESISIDSSNAGDDKSVGGNTDSDGTNSVRTALLIGIIAVVVALLIAGIVVGAVLILRKNK